MKSCPICSFARVGSALRCPNCQEALTRWINYDNYAKEAYGAGLHCLAQGDRATAAELLTQAVLLAPDEPDYGAALGRVLGQLGRYREAEWVLKRAHGQAPSAPLAAARDRAAALAEAPPGAPVVAAEATTPSPPAVAPQAGGPALEPEGSHPTTGAQTANPT